MGRPSPGRSRSKAARSACWFSVLTTTTPTSSRQESLVTCSRRPAAGTERCHAHRRRRRPGARRGDLPPSYQALAIRPWQCVARPHRQGNRGPPADRPRPIEQADRKPARTWLRTTATYPACSASSGWLREPRRLSTRSATTQPQAKPGTGRDGQHADAPTRAGLAARARPPTRELRI